MGFDWNQPPGIVSTPNSCVDTWPSHSSCEFQATQYLEQGVTSCTVKKHAGIQVIVVKVSGGDGYVWKRWIRKSNGLYNLYNKIYIYIIIIIIFPLAIGQWPWNGKLPWDHQVEYQRFEEGFLIRSCWNHGYDVRKRHSEDPTLGSLHPWAPGYNSEASGVPFTTFK